MKAVSKDHFTGNLIYADIYTPTTKEEIAALEIQLVYLQGQGQFEYRKISL